MAELPAIGNLIQLNNYSLHAYQMGEGNPTVVFVSGAGNDCLIWQLVQPQVAQFTSTLSYDRAGLGWSDSTNNSRSSEFIAQELDNLLSKTSTKPPYLLVGHSMGGIYARKYAELFPNNVAAMVLIDSSHEELNLRLPRHVQEADRTQEQALIGQLSQLLEMMAEMSHEEVTEYVKKSPDEPEAFPPEIVTLRRDRFRPKTVQAMIQEMRSMEANTSIHWEPTNILGSKPLAVLIAKNMVVDPNLTDEDNRKSHAIVQEAQRELLMLSTNSHAVMVSDSSHFIQVDQPQIVIDTIQDMVEQLRA